MSTTGLEFEGEFRSLEQRQTSLEKPLSKRVPKRQGTSSTVDSAEEPLNEHKSFLERVHLKRQPTLEELKHRAYKKEQNDLKKIEKAAEKDLRNRQNELDQLMENREETPGKGDEKESLAANVKELEKEAKRLAKQAGIDAKQQRFATLRSASDTAALRSDLDVENAATEARNHMDATFEKGALEIARQRREAMARCMEARAQLEKQRLHTSEAIEKLGDKALTSVMESQARREQLEDARHEAKRRDKEKKKHKEFSDEPVGRPPHSTTEYSQQSLPAASPLSGQSAEGEDSTTKRQRPEQEPEGREPRHSLSITEPQSLLEKLRLKHAPNAHKSLAKRASALDKENRKKAAEYDKELRQEAARKAADLATMQKEIDKEIEQERRAIEKEAAQLKKELKQQKKKTLAEASHAARDLQKFHSKQEKLAVQQIKQTRKQTQQAAEKAEAVARQKQKERDEAERKFQETQRIAAKAQQEAQKKLCKAESAAEDAVLKFKEVDNLLAGEKERAEELQEKDRLLAKSQIEAELMKNKIPLKIPRTTIAEKLRLKTPSLDNLPEMQSMKSGTTDPEAVGLPRPHGPAHFRAPEMAKRNQDSSTALKDSECEPASNSPIRNLRTPGIALAVRPSNPSLESESNEAAEQDIAQGVNQYNANPSAPKRGKKFVTPPSSATAEKNLPKVNLHALGETAIEEENWAEER